MPLQFSTLRLRIWIVASACALMLCAALCPTPCLALTAVSSNSKQTQDQVTQPNIFYNTTKPDFVEQESVEDLIKKNLHGSYSVSLMGPRLQGNSDETYNIYIEDISPVQLFHGVDLRYNVNPDLQIGIKDSAVQNLYDNVRGKTGNIYNHSFVIYDPGIFFNFPNLVQVPGWSVFTTVSLFLSLTQASQDVGKITSLDFSQGWSLNLKNTPWSFGFSLDLNPKFYTDPKPAGFNDRQTLYCSIGPNIGYRISPEFSLQGSGNFDWDHRAPDPQGATHFGTSLPDVYKLSATLSPSIEGLFISLGGYFQFLAWNATMDTTIIGADFSIGF